MPWLFYLLFAIGPALVLLWCVFRLLCPRKTGGFGHRIVRSVGLVGLCALPAVVLQMTWNSTGKGTTTFSWNDVMNATPWSWWVQVGGYSVQQIFERTAEAISGHRQSTMFDNWPWYMTLTVVQTALVSLVAATRLKKREWWRDAVVLVVAAAVVTNSLLGFQWPWWGT